MQSTLSPALPADVARARSGQGKSRSALTIVSFVLPALLLYILFVLYPIVQAAFYSLYDWNGLGPLRKFVGLDNYRRLFADGVFHMALSHNLTIALLSLCIQLPFALGVALLIRGNVPGRALFRTIFFLPYVLSEVVTAIVWVFIYRPENGLVNILLSVVPGFE